MTMMPCRMREREREREKIVVLERLFLLFLKKVWGHGHPTAGPIKRNFDSAVFDGEKEERDGWKRRVILKVPSQGK
jgi:hypothetical protein